MNTKIIIVIVVFFSVMGGVWYSMRTPVAEAPIAISNKDTSKDLVNKEFGENFAGTGSLAVLMTRGKNIKCTFSSTDEGAETEGTFMYSNGRYRVDSSVTTDGATYVTNIINTDEWNYIWGNGPEGDMAIVIDATVTNDDETANTFAANPNNFKSSVEDTVQYDCSRWNPDSSVFVPPSDIEFIDMQTMLEDAFGGELPSFPEGFDPSNLPQPQ